MTARSDPNRAPTPSAPNPQQQPSTSRSEATPAAKDPLTEASGSSSRSRRLAEQAEQREAELQRKEAERNQKQQRTILGHARTVRRCLQYGTKIMDRYDVSGCGLFTSDVMMLSLLQRAAARIAARKTGGGAKRGGEGEDGESWEPMETVGELEERGAFDVHMEDTFPELDRSTDDPCNLR